MVVKYMHHGNDLVEHRTREASFGAQCTNHSANSINVARVRTLLSVQQTGTIENFKISKKTVLHSTTCYICGLKTAKKSLVSR